ncbi:MAG: hypothetical protein HYZ25_05755 [Chloroflexi bacterium]|nr:hypothetical protein [Chloroflexota bacterium]
MFKNFFRLISVVFVIVLVASCSPLTPAAPLALQSLQTSTATPLPSLTPTVAFYDNFSHSYVPSATPTFIPLGNISPDLEIISPENIGRLELINRWGKGKLLESKVSPDNTIVATATTTGVYLYDAQDLKQIGYLGVNPTDRQFMKIGFSPDSKVLAVAGAEVSIWDVASQRKSGIIPIEKIMHQPWSIEFTPDGKHIAIEEITYFCGGGGIFALYTIEGYKVFDAAECGPNEGGMDGYSRIVDGKWFYFFTNPRYLDSKAFPNEVIKVDLITDKIVDVIRNDVLREFYDISPDGKLAAYSIGTKTEENNSYTMSFKTEIVDTETGQVKGDKITWQSPTNNQQFQTWPNSSNDIVRNDKLVFANIDSGSRGYYFDKNGNKLIFPTFGSISVLDVRTGEFDYSISSASIEDRFGYIGLNLDGSRMVLGWQKIEPGGFYIDNSRFVGYTLKMVDTMTGEIIWSHDPNGSRLEQILPGADSSTMLVEDNLGLHVWNLKSGAEERSIANAGAVYQSPDGQQYIFVANNIVHFWDVKNWKDLTTFAGGELHYVRKISPMSKNGRIAILYTLGEDPWADRRVAVFDIQAGKKVYELNEDKSNLGLIGSQPYFVNTRNDGYVELWSIDQNTPINIFLEKNVSGALWWDTSSSLLSPDNQMFVTPTNNNEIEFWDVKSGKLLAKVLKCNNPIFSPDGRTLVTVGDDGTFWVWGVKKQ